MTTRTTPSRQRSASERPPRRRRRDRQSTRVVCAVICSTRDFGYTLIQNGIRLVFQRLKPDIDFRFTVIDKHAPMGSSDYWQRAAHEIGLADALVLAGGPILWPYVERADWAEHLTDCILRRSREGAPMAGIALGSCYGIQSDGLIPPPRDEEVTFGRRLLKRATVVTYRDSLARDCLESVGVTGVQLPCIGLLGVPQSAPRRLKHRRPIVAISYMTGAGHHDYLNIVRPDAWRTMVTAFVRDLDRSGYHVRFMCHSPSEYELVPLISERAERHLILTTAQFAEVGAGCAAAVCNRIHATIGLAGLQVPALTIGTDSRLLSVRELQLPFRVLPAMNDQDLRLDFERLATDAVSIRTRLATLWSETLAAYERELTPFVTEVIERRIAGDGDNRARRHQ